jgi:glutamate--cysteine ligase
MIEKLRLALCVSPIVSAIFANSSVSESKANGFVSKRLDAWEDTDVDRTGMLPFAFDSDFGYRRYTEWALDVRMFFIVRNGRYEPAKGLTFRLFLDQGYRGTRATLADFDRHLTTLFPDVRLKKIIEVRGADAVPSGLTCSLPALWKGLFYDADAREEARALVDYSTHESRLDARRDVARRGLGAEFAGRRMLDLARELVRISRGGLRRIGHSGATESDECVFLDPVDEQLDRGASPGQVILEHWNGDWQNSLDRLIDYARY